MASYDPSSSSSPTLLSRRPTNNNTRPGLGGRASSFQRQLRTQGPTPPSLVDSTYLQSPKSVFNGGAGARHENRLTPPNEHDKLHLLDTVRFRLLFPCFLFRVFSFVLFGFLFDLSIRERS
jgi:hypothetical protein